MTATRRPERIAHRGAKLEHRENTLPAFLTAITRGAEGIELDVHATADGVVVVHHDPVLGSGMYDRSVAGTRLDQMSAAALRELPFATGEVIPTLAEVLTAVPPHITVYVEVKARGIAPQVAAVVAPHAGRVAVHAFDHRIPPAVAVLVPGVPAGILLDSYLLDPVGAMTAAGARDLWQHWEQIDPPLVAAVHAARGRVIAWTANAPEAIRALADMGVDGLCADDLRVVREVLGD